MNALRTKEKALDIKRDRERDAQSHAGSYQLGGRFAQLSNFISDLETKVPEFYGQVGQNLNQWKRSPPKINSATDDVDVEAIVREAEEY